MTDEQIRQIYNKFPEGQTLRFEDFKKQVKELTDPVKAKEDLDEICMQKAVFNANKTQIDRKLN